MWKILGSLELERYYRLFITGATGKAIYAEYCEPRYVHDCDPENGCIFVGQVGDDDIWFHDYYNKGAFIYTCVVMRHSSDPPDYGTWGSGLSYNEIPEAYQQAISLVVRYKATN